MSSLGFKLGLGGLALGLLGAMWATILPLPHSTKVEIADWTILIGVGIFLVGYIMENQNEE